MCENRQSEGFYFKSPVHFIIENPNVDESTDEALVTARSKFLHITVNKEAYVLMFTDYDLAETYLTKTGRHGQIIEVDDGEQFAFLLKALNCEMLAADANPDTKKFQSLCVSELLESLEGDENT